MTTADALRSALAENLGPRMSKRPEAAAFCSGAADALVAWRERIEDMGEFLGAAFPDGAAIRRRNAGKAVAMLVREVQRMTPHERLDFGVSCGLLSALADSPDDDPAEAKKRLSAVFEGLREPEPPKRPDKRQRESGDDAWIARILADQWRQHFGVQPRASDTGPFTSCAQAVYTAMDCTKPKAETIARLICLN